MLELYHWEPVSHSARVLITLQEIGVEYRSHYVDLLEFEQFDAEFLGVNKAGQVPALIAGDQVLTESTLINQYLAESYPDAQLAPTDAKGWYDVQTWSKWIDYNLASALATLATQRYLAPELATMDAEALQEAVAKIPVAERKPGWEIARANDYSDEVVADSKRKVKLVTERMESVLAERDWLAADRYSIADIDTFAMIASLARVAPDVVNADATPLTMAWAKKIAARPAVTDSLAKNNRFEAGTMFAPGPEHSRWG